ncbi:MAG TPA: AbrB/MazE/SpoVT family DNA-binding domain-containing protein [Syntrophorhabdales bacterium]|nr:AbrB/MazE/SpoVT family DNA-binding domain-containing protein [Syntrophorhabdales bacterium]
MLVDLKQKSQVTIPKRLVKKLNLKTGDKLEIEEEAGRLVITPVIVIPRDQAWFHRREWQKKEEEVDRQKEEGRIHKASGKKELFEKLGLDEV